LAKRKFYLEELGPNAERQFLSVRKQLDPLGGRFDNSLHWHDYYEIELVIGGSGTHIFNGNRYPLSRGSAYLLSPKDFHTVIENAEDPLKLYNINFNEQILPRELLQTLTAAECGICASFNEAETVRLSALCEQMLTELSCEQTNGREMIVALFTQFLIMLVRRGAQTLSDGTRESRQPQVGRVISYLKAHFREPISLADCAGMVYLTPNYLGEIFCRETGMRFRDYLRRLRFSYAVDLLQTTDITIDAISYHAGFPSASYFAALFRKEYHMTPTQFRETQKKRQKIE